MRIPSLLLLAALAAVAGCRAAPGVPALEPYTAGPYRPGQEWRYATRRGETGSTALVTVVERTADGEVIVHVSLEGLRIRNPVDPSMPVAVISHLPLTEAAFRRSVTHRVRDDAPVPAPAREGHATWRAAYEAGRARAFDVPIADALTVVEDGLGGG